MSAGHRIEVYRRADLRSWPREPLAVWDDLEGPLPLRGQWVALDGLGDCEIVELEEEVVDGVRTVRVFVVPEGEPAPRAVLVEVYPYFAWRSTPKNCLGSGFATDVVPARGDHLYVRGHGRVRVVERVDRWVETRASPTEFPDRHLREVLLFVIPDR